jgi:nicotinate-nucleotide adenylyltransferase
MNLTIFAGTYNPIHLAHLVLAETIRTELAYEKILFVPCFNPPHRTNELALPEHRLNMMKLSTKDNLNFEVSDIEYRLGGKSYSVNTIKQLYLDYPEIQGRINFIIGEDAFFEIKTWHKAEELIKLVKFIVLGRTCRKKLLHSISSEELDYVFLDTPQLDISSSLIRKRIQEKKSIKYLVMQEVEEYILKNNLYNF